ncbi:hypothetical protein KAU11_03035 [Candidatus Babeliales bacterium]|nr:hypothetical protein [Candidatus Babeliales bacterium]
MQNRSFGFCLFLLSFISNQINAVFYASTVLRNLQTGKTVFLYHDSHEDGDDFQVVGENQVDGLKSGLSKVSKDVPLLIEGCGIDTDVWNPLLGALDVDVKIYATKKKLRANDPEDWASGKLLAVLFKEKRAIDVDEWRGMCKYSLEIIERYFRVLDMKSSESQYKIKLALLAAGKVLSEIQDKIFGRLDGTVEALHSEVKMVRKGIIEEIGSEFGIGGQDSKIFKDVLDSGEEGFEKADERLSRWNIVDANDMDTNRFSGFHIMNWDAITRILTMNERRFVFAGGANHALWISKHLKALGFKEISSRPKTGVPLSFKECEICSEFDDKSIDIGVSQTKFDSKFWKIMPDAVTLGGFGISAIACFILYRAAKQQVEAQGEKNEKQIRYIEKKTAFCKLRAIILEMKRTFCRGGAVPAFIVGGALAGVIGGSILACRSLKR